MSTDANSKSAQATVMEPPVYAETIDQDTGLNSSFVPKNLPLQANQSPYESVSQQNTGASIASSTNPFRRSSGATAPASASKNPFSHTREISSGSAHGAPEKVGATSHIRQISADKGTSSHVRNLSNGSPRGSPRRERFPDMDPFTDGSSERRSIDKGYRGEFGEGSKSSGLRRNSSLKERFPGDKSVRPLDVLKEEDRKAYRAPHLKKRHIPGADTIDSLDEAIGGRYHHEGPYDATLLARNTSFTSSPVAALKTTNEEALRATPEEAIKDSLTRHRPLDNVAAFAPGETDSMGRRYNYEESDNMNIAEGGNLGRLDGVEYKDSDEEGVGEPAYSMERRAHQKGKSAPVDGDYIELAERTKPIGETEGVGRSTGAAGTSQGYADWERSQSGARKGSLSTGIGSLKKRIGSIRRKKDQE